jgi:hypothetical protein
MAAHHVDHDTRPLRVNQPLVFNQRTQQLGIASSESRRRRCDQGCRSETDDAGEVQRIDAALKAAGTALMHRDLPAGMADAQLPAGEGDAHRRLIRESRAGCDFTAT